MASSKYRLSVHSDAYVPVTNFISLLLERDIANDNPVRSFKGCHMYKTIIEMAGEYHWAESM